VRERQNTKKTFINAVFAPVKALREINIYRASAFKIPNHL